MISAKIAASTAFIIVLASSSAGDDSQEGLLRFTLPQAVEVALALNPEVLGEREKTEEFSSLVSEARAEALPELNLALGYRQNRDPGLRNSPFFARLLEGPDPIPAESLSSFFFTNYIWNFEVSQPVYTFGRVSNAMNAAKQERTGVNLDVNGVENRISYDVVRACYGFLLAQQSLAVLETERTSRERQLAQVEARFELGDATRLDALRARVTLANLAPEILAAENNLQIAEASVNNTLGRPVDAPFEIVAELSLGDAVPSILRPEALLELAGEHRPELRRFAVDRQVLDSRIGVTRSELRPQIRANAGFGVNTFADQNVTNLALHTWVVGVSMDWKLFDGFRTRSQVGALRSQITQNEHDEHAFRNELSVQLKEAHGTWLRALEALEVTTLAVEGAREAERVAEESLKWGAATTLDVIQSTLALRQAELNQMTASHDALVALAEMKYLVGFRADSPHSVIEAPSSVASAERDP
ncbi:MAG TPA: TolC family protein [Vicinamibacteria bacterium]|nr:TolC family protein [Vicinamibacteria bacterium]